MQQMTRANGAVTTTQTQITKTKMRTEISDPATGSQVVIFDGAAQVMYRLDVTRKTYTEMTKADVERMGSQMQGMMAQMQAQMASLPPAQRAQMEAMMRGRGAAMAAPASKTEYKRSGTDRVGRWTCDKYDGIRDGQKASELCTVAPTALGFAPADFEVAQQLAEFFSKMMPQAADQITSVGRTEVQGFSGLPVRTITYVNGQSVTSEITPAGRHAVPDSAFEIPTGFTKQTMPMMGGASRGR